MSLEVKGYLNELAKINPSAYKLPRLLRLTPPGLAMPKHETYESNSVYIVPSLRVLGGKTLHTLRLKIRYEIASTHSTRPRND
ncbi:hypothetical protein SAMN04488023_1366 [Pedobacter rhizosphaerae]|uniref:Uncharacterized protein n=1 Tax=Pedobacter rhizosphaerae TaxID=390241 RepID=A0A1H9V0E7_9SPHI|nr:hypothetical protein SAMN04488023_1366 [Pedobacter rhizosphaerae]